MKKIGKLILRFLVTFSLLIYLSTKIDFHKLSAIIYKTNFILLFFASLLYILSSYLSTLRWKLFIPLASDFRVKPLFSVYMIGCFFNMFLPGIMGGDVVKILLIKKNMGLKEAIASVFIERYIGFFALLLLGNIFFIAFFESIPNDEKIYLIPLSFLIFILVTILLFFIRSIPFFREIKQYLTNFHKKIFLQAFLYSILIQLTVMISVYLVSLSLRTYIPFHEIVIFLPLIIILSTLPISLSGIGVREWSFIFFFGPTIGNENAIAISFLWFFSVLVASLYGGIEYLRFKDLFNMHYKK